jgi:hypothetical protein
MLASIAVNNRRKISARQDQWRIGLDGRDAWEGSIVSYATAGRRKKSPWLAERAMRMSGIPSAMATSTPDALVPACLITS